MTDRCTCLHPWRDHATSCYAEGCPCNCQPVPVHPAPDMALAPARWAMREAYTLLVSAEPTLIRDAQIGQYETSLHFKAVLRDRVSSWLDPIRGNFDAWFADISNDAPVCTHPAPDPDPCPHCDPRHEWPCPTIPRCDRPWCEKEATCGWPSDDGYRRTCGDHSDIGSIRLEV